MGRSLSPLKRELANLDKDAESRKSAMKALKSYVKDMDSRAIPLFLAQVSETKETGSISGEYTISLYEVLARVHGVKIVSQIDRIMPTVIKTLSASAVSFSLQQACSKVVPAIARYGIEPTTPEVEKRRIIHSLCKPLVEALLGAQETLTSGAALCLKALVDSDNWRFASDEMVNKVCQNVAVALEEQSTQSNSHMGLVMALSKRNALIVEPYARLLIQTGLCILNAGGGQDGNSQKRMSAIQMINFMMKCLDPRSIFSMLDLIILEMDKCQSDQQMAFVKGAAFEALQTAKKISCDEASKLDKSCGDSVTGSNFSKRDHRRRRNLSSPESQTLGSFMEYDSMVESPLTRNPVSHAMGYDCGCEYDRRSVNRKLWNLENGRVDVSLKDGLFSQLTHGTPITNTSTEYEGDRTAEFSGFLPISPKNRLPRSCTPSPQDSNGGMNPEFNEKHSRRFRRSPCTCNCDNSPTSKLNQEEFDRNEDGYVSNENERSESVSSTVDVGSNAVEVGDMNGKLVAAGKKSKVQSRCIKKQYWKTNARLIVAFVLAMLSGFASLILFDGSEQAPFLPPT
ncbi:Protein SINE1 [Linum grandiflorum]